ncbi:alpha/beta fold hydrolase [Streptomyces coeruleoprunus]|uniref:Alpha/beta fold hydrolase n=1 Tax=Streptomyces coeruleoprunus TaxID=285563 RepID=A0ABV9XE43_9ACTN
MGIGAYRSPEAHARFIAAYESAMRVLPEPVDTHDVATAYGTVRVYRFGPLGNDPLVLLPGRAATSVMWRPNLPRLAEHRPVFTVEPLGEPGLSKQTAPLRGAQDQADWLEAALAGLGLHGIHLVGHSFGGWLACNYAARMPGRLASLTLLDPVRTLGDFPVELLLRSALTAVPGVSRWARPAFFRWINGGVAVRREDPVADLIAAGMRDYRMATPMPPLITDSQLRSLALPVLALVAGRSVMHDPQAALARAQAQIPGVRAELWPAATHSLPSESPAETDAAILRFVDSVTA